MLLGNGFYNRQVEVFGEEMADIDWSSCGCEDYRQLHLEDVLHWIHQEAPKPSQEDLLCPV